MAKLTDAQRGLLGGPPGLGQQEFEIINLLHTDPAWREAQLQDIRARFNDPGAHKSLIMENQHAQGQAAREMVITEETSLAEMALSWQKEKG